MEVWSSVMGPERVLPSSEEELGEDQRPADGALLPVGAVWSGGEGGAEEEEEQGGDMELDVEEEEEEVSSGGYYYQPLNQDPDGVNGTEQPEDEEEEQSHVEQLQQVQHQIEVSSAVQQVTHCITPEQRFVLGHATTHWGTCLAPLVHGTETAVSCLGQSSELKPVYCSFQSYRTPLTKTVIAPGRTQGLLVYCCSSDNSPVKCFVSGCINQLFNRLVHAAFSSHVCVDIILKAFCVCELLFNLLLAFSDSLYCFGCVIIMSVVSPFPVRSDHVELVKRTMATVALPSLGVPAWAQEISDDQWKDMVQHTLQSRQSASALRLSHRGDP
uniref:male-enhanced antigen 1 n=1 Tax=Monopterus albus TaxID=43700 RepID=UPI0009B44110|nr:male-enhanced antigen 1 [Monopterus albus]